jgi:glutamine---fructose-6-phosphate transaminase (isomerizing)
MCGIFGVVGVKNAAKIVFNGLKKLEYRGYDSWGITVGGNNSLARERQLGKIGSAKINLPQSTISLGHTRWATHGKVTISNTHPHLDCTGKLSLVHNGIIENYQKLKQVLRSHQFHSETDSEVALHLIEENLKTNSLKNAVQRTFRKLTGLNAFILLSAQTEELVAVKTGSPLIIGLSEEYNLISSDVWALTDHTDRLIYLEDNQMASITAKRVIVYDALTGKKIKPKISRLNLKSQTSRLGKFRHYTEKEIYDQPKLIRTLAEIDKKTFQPVVKTIKSAKQVCLVGCGTAYFAALFGEYLLNQAGIEAESIVASEFNKNKALLRGNKIYIMLSQSGETIDVIEAVNLIKKHNLKVIGITNNQGSTLSRLADHTIQIQAGQETAVASTKAFSAKLSLLILLESMLKSKLSASRQLLTKISQFLDKLCLGDCREQIKRLASTIKHNNHLFVIGRLFSYPIALEAALKIKEISYIHAEALPGGELKHGPIALIENKTPCLVLAPNDQTYTDQISAAHEIKARGGYIIGISTKNNPVFDEYLQVPDLKQATVIAMTVITQLLAYDLATARGINPDKPRNLAKSVTVK